MRTFRLGSLVLAVAVISSAFVVAAPVLAAQRAPAPVTQYEGTGGIASVVPRAAARQRGARRLTPPAGAAAAVGPGVAAAPSATVGRLLHNFNGVSSLDSAKTNFGLEFEPPDQGLCVGNGFVLEAVNSAFAVYRPDGRRVIGPDNVNDLFNIGASEFSSDPRCYFDKSTNTWFAVILFLNNTFTASTINIAVNTSGDPTTPWTQFVFDTSDNGANGRPVPPGCPCFADQPRLGIDQFNVYITGDEFSINGPQFNGPEIYAISKADLEGQRSPAHFARFAHLSIGGEAAVAMQPAISSGAPAAEYFMNSFFSGETDNRLGVWAMTNRERVTTGGRPTLSSTVITSEPYSIPPNARQKGSKSLINTDDDRMQQTQFINGSLWGELTTGVTIPHDRVTRSGAAWFQVHPRLNGERIAGAAIERQGYVVSPGNYVMFPVLQADAAGRAAMGVSISGRDLYPSTAYATLGADDASFGPLRVSAHGTGPYARTSTRWGDYAWAVLDPSADAVWLANEYVPPVSSQTLDRKQNWGTRVVEVALS